MRLSLATLIAGGLLVQTVAGKARNLIFVIPDGHGPAHQTLLRTYLSQVTNGEDSISSPNIESLFVDDYVRVSFSPGKKKES